MGFDKMIVYSVVMFAGKQGCHAKSNSPKK